MKKSSKFLLKFISFWKWCWLAINNKKVELDNIHVAAPIGIENTLNYIEWSGKHITHCFVTTKSKTIQVRNERYYFVNDSNHSNIKITLKGYNKKKKTQFYLKFLNVKKEETQKPTKVKPNSKLIDQSLSLSSITEKQFPALKFKKEKAFTENHNRLVNISLNIHALKEKLTKLQLTQELWKDLTINHLHPEK